MGKARELAQCFAVKIAFRQSKGALSRSWVAELGDKLGDQFGDLGDFGDIFGDKNLSRVAKVRKR